ncbi:SulP family inorganic anion transporter [Salibacter halophilus]|uniref:SulP family inorganic anion transporter n=1 Tax=Salibacter halophilus TaxID=1803916 RepID=A0A6N6M5M2_9FLAO|nr:SulP family inorganic anion transporter [Salibacter halophilus]KAB1062121.1 SulP family inorganic anion transporter [Salibacter halophilus]
MFKYVGKDLPASIVVFLVALPLCLGIALASGAPLFSGLISGIVGGIVAGILSGSHTSVSGPAAGLTVIVYNGIETLGSYEIFLLAVIMAGVLQFILGVVRAGVIGYYFPTSVIKGMLAAIGLILILKQIPHAFGYDVDPEGDMEFIQVDQENTFSEIINAINFIHPGALIVSMICLLVLILLKSTRLSNLKLLSYIPAELWVVLLGIGLNSLFKLQFPDLEIEKSHLVDLPIADNLMDFAAQFTLPDFSALGNTNLYAIAVTVAMVASLETLLSLEAADKLDPKKRISPANRELRAQGVSNVVSGLIGGLPVTAVIVRSTANISAGGQTKLSAILHGVLLLVCIYLIPDFLNLIPLSCLAAILLMVGYKLIEPKIITNMYKKGKDQFIPFAVTIIAIMFSNLLVGIGIGIAVGLLFVIRSNFRKAFTFSEADGDYEMRFNKDVTFINKALILSQLEKVKENSHLVIDASQSTFIDSDIREALDNFKDSAADRNITVEFKGMQNSI